LLEHMRPYIELENGGPVSTDDSGIVIDDSEVMLEGESNGAPASEGEAGANVEAEVETFANLAFDRLLESERPKPLESDSPKEEKSTERRLARASIAPRASVPPRPTVDAEVERLQTEVERQKTELARLERELSTARADVQRLEDNEQREAASNEQVVKLQREL